MRRAEKVKARRPGFNPAMIPDGNTNARLQPGLQLFNHERPKVRKHERVYYQSLFRNFVLSCFRDPLQIDRIFLEARMQPGLLHAQDGRATRANFISLAQLGKLRIR